MLPLFRFGRVVAGAILLAGLCAASPRLVSAADPAPAAAADADAGFERAQALFRDRKFSECVAAATAFIAAHPRDARALVLRGDCKADLQDNSGALKDYNSAIAVAPDYQYAYVTRCETRLELGEAAGALADCDTAVRLDGTDGLAYEDRGDVQFELDAYDLALLDYDKAISLGRSSAYVYAARCDTERLVNKRDRAKPDCEKALEIDPKSRRGLFARARLAMVETRYVDGIADLNAYIALNPKASDTAYYYRGFSYNRISKFALALEDLRTFVQLRPSDPDGYRERGLASFELGDKTGALADFDVALRGYRRDGNTTAADRVAAMVKAIADGKAPTP
jgi:tetratricopeptide (TPR) repeat protein